MSVLPRPGDKRSIGPLGRLAGPALRVLLGIAGIGTAGCVSVHIAQANGQVHTIRQLGVLKVEMKDAEQAFVGSSAGFGVIGTPLGWSAGYTRQRWALLGPGCRAVVWVAPGAVVDAGIREGLARIAGVCLHDEVSSSSTQLTEVSP